MSQIKTAYFDALPIANTLTVELAQIESDIRAINSRPAGTYTQSQKSERLEALTAARKAKQSEIKANYAKFAQVVTNRKQYLQAENNKVDFSAVDGARLAGVQYMRTSEILAYLKDNDPDGDKITYRAVATELQKRADTEKNTKRRQELQQAAYNALTADTYSQRSGMIDNVVVWASRALNGRDPADPSRASIAKAAQRELAPELWPAFDDML